MSMVSSHGSRGLVFAVGLLSACGDDPRADAGSSVADETGTASTGAEQSTGDGDPSTGAEQSTGDGDPSTGDGDPSTGDGDPSTGDGDPVKFDLNPITDGGAQGCGGGMGNMPEFSYIYISNTAQGTLTKLNTQTMIEEGRYVTRPNQNGSPSRTSVNLSGDVAVANRNGGLTKVYARVEDCQDSNGTPGIQTSANKDDILAWGEEECVAWYTPFPQYTSQRPIAWTAGDFNEGTCKYSNQKVWSSGRVGNQVEVVRLDGDTGALEATIAIPGIDVGSFGAYGGVVDGDGGFWIMTYVSGFPLVHVFDDLSYEIHMAPQSVHPYGITIDHNGRVWIAADIGGTARFDPETEPVGHHQRRDRARHPRAPRRLHVDGDLAGARHPGDRRRDHGARPQHPAAGGRRPDQGREHRLLRLRVAGRHGPERVSHRSRHAAVRHLQPADPALHLLGHDRVGAVERQQPAGLRGS